MSLLRRALAMAVLAGSVLAVAPQSVSAEPASGAVYVLSNQVGGNQVLVYTRHPDGTLTPGPAYSTGGAGTGAGLGSQGAVVLDDTGRHLYAVNAGSDSVSSFRIRPDGLQLLDVVGSGGTMPTSVTVHDGLLYVLNAGGTGNITGFRTTDGDLQAIRGSTRALSGAATSPAQVSFTPGGAGLVVTERASNRLDLYRVRRNGRAEGPTTFAASGITPFGFAFDNKGHAIVSEAFGGAPDASAVSSYEVTRTAISLISPSVATTETAACWVATTGNGRFAYVGNAGTASVTGYSVASDGSLTILNQDGKTASAAAGVTDLAVSRNSRFLYGRLSNGTVGAWAIGADGSLADLGASPGLPTGAAGITAK